MKRHPLDPFSLVSGLIVLATAAVLLPADPDVTLLARYSPLAIIAIGVALLFTSRTRGGDTEPAEAGAGQAGAASHLDDPQVVPPDGAYDDALPRTDDDPLDDEATVRDPLSEDPASTRPIPRAD